MIIDLKCFHIPFYSDFPTKVVFGDGCLEKLGEICHQYGDSALLITWHSSLKAGTARFCKELLYKHSIQVIEYHAISSDPTVHQVNEIAKIARKNKSKVIIGVGGGSVIDAAKIASIMVKQGGNAEDYLLGKIPVGNSSLPLIAVPTTAGTGSELSKGAIISWPEKGIKRGIRGNSIFPTLALVDPLLTLSLPIEQVKITGFDCFSHAVETYISNLATPLTTIFSSNTIKAVTKYLPIALINPQNIIARRNLSFFSMLMGYNLANSSTCLPHRLQYPLGSLTSTPHGLGIAALYPAWINITHKTSPSKFTDVANWIAEGLMLKIDRNYKDAPSLVNAFMEKIKLKITIKEMGCSVEDCNEMASSVVGKLESDPWWGDGKDLAKFYLFSIET